MHAIKTALTALAFPEQRMPVSAEPHMTACARPAPADLRACALRAVQEAIQAVPNLLDLKVDITVMVPKEWVEEVVHAMQARSDIVCSVPSDNGYCIIIGRMALKHSFGYAERLKSLSQGTGSFTMRLAKHSQR